MVNPSLDEMLETPEAAKWLKLKPRRLLADAKGRRAKIPGFWINRRVVRFHPRTIIAKFANDAGVPIEVIGAMFELKIHVPESFPKNQNPNPPTKHECHSKN